MDINQYINQVKQNPDFHKAGMVLCHNGVVRSTSRDGKPVTGLMVAVDHERLSHIIQKEKQSAGIVDIVVDIAEGRRLNVGDDVMVLVVAGDIRDRVIPVLERTLNAIKQTVTTKTEFFD